MSLSESPQVGRNVGQAHGWKRVAGRVLRYCLPFVLGGVILYWMYHDLDWATFAGALRQTRWFWLILSFVPGIVAQMLRGMRWQLALRPLGERPALGDCIWAVFMSYGVSLVVPRMGEVARCGILRRYDGTNFARSLGTVVTERLVDIVVLLVLIGIVFLVQIPVITKVLSITGVSVDGLTDRLTGLGLWIVVGVLVVVVAGFGFYAARKRLGRGLREGLRRLGEGLLSLRRVNLPIYMCYAVGTWLCYFLHYYLTFWCFDFTEQLGVMAALVSFCVGTIAVILPTPNGAGPWHFAVTTVLVLYGVAAKDAALFALIIHLVQTMLLIVLAAFGWFCFLTRKRTRALEGEPDGEVDR